MSTSEMSGERYSRVITAVLLAVVAVTVVWLFSTRSLAWLLAAVAVIAAWEWNYLLTVRRTLATATAVGFAALFALIGFVQHEQLLNIILYLSVAWWFLLFILVAAYRSSWCGAAWMRVLLHVGMLPALVGAWVAALELHGLGGGYLLYLFLLVWVSDIGAYYVGRRWGRRRLIPELSPGKSVAGLWGGLAAVAMLAIAAASLSVAGSTVLGMIDFVLLSLLTALVGVVGDLSVSMLKRTAGRKNSSALLPGHGGVLDRIDSTLAAAPLFLLALKL